MQTKVSDIEMLTGAQSVLKWARISPKETAIVHGAIEYSYFDLAVYITQFVKALEESGVRRGMLVGIQSQDKYLSLILGLSIEVIGAATLFLSKNEIAQSEAISHCEALIIENLVANLGYCAVLIHLTQDWITAHVNTTVSNVDLGRLHHRADEQDTVYVWGTSGTTGNKKYFNVKRKTVEEQLQLRYQIYFYDGKTSNYISLYGPVLGTAFLSGIIALNLGAKIIFSDLDSLLTNIENYPGSKATIILRDAEYLSRKFPSIQLRHKLDSLRVIGAFLPNTLRDWLERCIAHRVVNSYSSNEMGQIAAVQSDGVGLMYPGVEVKIVDDQKRPVPYGEVGNIALKVSPMITEYLWNAELNAKHFFDGWFLSSDVGYMPEANKLVVVGRADNMLNLGGVKIAPEPFEAQIKRIDGVVDCVLLSDNMIFGIGKVVVCVEIKRDLGEGNTAIVALLKRLFQYFTLFNFEEFPRTETGKVRRNILRKFVADHLSR